MGKLLLVLVSVRFILDPGTAAAQPSVHLVRDLNTTLSAVNPGSDPSSLVVAGGYLYFQADDGVHGSELWRSDGTTAGVVLVKDICSGPCSSRPLALTAAGDSVFFLATDGASGVELWVSDGTAPGTLRVGDLCVGVCSFFHSPMVGLGSELLFYRRDLGELWKSDGTPAGTRPLLALPAQPFHFGQPDPAEAGGLLYFSLLVNPTETAGLEQQLWRTDGTTPGTFLLRAFDPPVDVFPGVADEGLFFAAFDPAHGRELWFTDGTVAGTSLAVDLVPGPADSSPLAMSRFHDRLYVSTRHCFDTTCAFTTDGTSAGTAPAAALQPLGGDRITHLFSTPDQLFFVRRQFQNQVPTNNFDELWRTDGGASQRLWVGRYQNHLATLGDKLVFSAAQLDTGIEPWVSDGTQAGTRLLRDIWPGPQHSAGLLRERALLDGLAFFRAEDGSSGQELWVTDGTPEGTELTVDLARPRRSSDPREFLRHGTGVAFLASASFEDGTVSPSLVHTDGTPEGTRVLVRDFPARALTAVGDRIFATTFDKLLVTDGLRPSAADGTAAGTLELATALSTPTELTPTASGVLFNGDRFYGQKLWTSDGTAAGTHLLLDINPGYFAGCFRNCAASAPFPRSLTPVSGATLFVAFEEDRAPQLWRSDATAAGTFPIYTFDVGDRFAHLASPRELTPFGQGVVFVAFEEDTGWGLWSSDGTEAATGHIASPSPDPQTQPPTHLTRVGETVYFALPRSEGGEELWLTDGTIQGTQRVAELLHEEQPSTLVDTVGVGERLFLSVFNPKTGAELWTSDGTAPGTRLVEDIHPGIVGSNPQSLTAIAGPADPAGEAGQLLFAADGGLRGLELWTSDGTEAGTFRVQDIARGPQASSPHGFIELGDRVVFAAQDLVHGRELFVLEADPLPRRPPCPPDRLCLHQNRFQLEVAWRDFTGNTGSGQPVASSSDDSGLFWFFGDTNWELLVKVLDGCSINDRFWLFAAATTNVEYALKVTDTLSGEVIEYTNPLGRTAPATTNTGAFAGCPTVQEPISFLPPPFSPTALAATPAAPAVPARGFKCISGPSTACLSQERFQVEVEWRDPHGNAGRGRVVPHRTPDSGLFWFFVPWNWEMLVKVLDGCEFNGRFWVFAAATTNLGYSLRVTDTRTGTVKVYENEVDRASPALTDTGAFATCP